MSWLVGLPLGIFRILGGILLFLLRFGLPILLILLAIWLYRRRRGGSSGKKTRRPPPPRKPKFDGPVYTVDYEDVDPPDDEKKM